MANNFDRIWKGIKDTVIIEIDRRVNLQLPTGTVQSITAGDGLSANPNPITKVGTISLDAGVSDLNDTAIDNTTLCPDNILSWNGTSWINKAYPGLSGTSVCFVDLRDVDVNLTNSPGYILSINSAGTSVVSVANNFITKNTGIKGVRTSLVGSEYTTEFYPATIQVDPPRSTDFLVYYRTGIGGRQWQFNNINISNFNDDLSLLTGGDLLEGTAITITQGVDGTRTIGVSTTQLTVDFNAGVSGVLGLANGGTSGTTSASARQHLGLEYNVDILTKTGPSFTGEMFGNDITLLNRTFGVSLLTGGTGYTNGATLTLYNADTNYSFTAPVTITTNSGVITGPSYFNLTATNLGLSDSNTTLEVTNVGSGASYQLIPDPIYLLFGGSTASTGIGLRDRQGILELKSTHTSGNGSTWQQVFPLAVGGLCDVTTNNLSNNQFLIYNTAGSSFVNTTLTGNADYSFVFSQSGSQTTFAITPADNSIGISKLDSSTGVTKTEFDYLSGLTSNIQNQLNLKIGTSPNGTEPSTGDMVWYSGTCWSIISAPALNPHYILGVSQANNIPFYSYLHSYTATAPTPAWLTDEFVYVKSNTTPAYRTTLPDFMEDNLCNPTGGLGFTTVGKQLELDITNLKTGTSFSSPTSNSIVYYNSLFSETRKMDIVNLAGQLAGTNLTGNTDGTISIMSGLSTPLKLKRYNNGTSLYDQASPVTYDGAIAGLSIATSSGTSLVFSNGTSWYIVPLGDWVPS